MLRAFGDGLFGDVYGELPADVLALPGWMRKRSDFRSVLDGLNAVALDLPGFGGASPAPSAASGGAWGAAGYATAVAPALDACAQRVVIVGHSFGGRVAVHVAARLGASAPDRIAGLVLSGVPLLRRDDRPAPKVSWAHRAARWANRRGLLSDERMERRRRSRGSEDYRNASGVMRDVLVTVVNETYEEQLQAVRCPVWLVWGADDDAAPVSTAKRAADLVQGEAHLTVVGGHGHLLPLSAPETIRSAVEEALA